ncbi:MAG: hypothetical protein OSB63_00420 [Planctomycetota bacterium]|nr:hypothetical protein [Planctomycetota bacterium]
MNFKIIIALVLLLSFTPAIDSDLENAAVAKMKKDGYQPVEISWAAIKGEPWLVVEYGWNKYMTDEMPSGISKHSADAGKYWATTKPFGGISALVDEEGNEHIFTWSDWKDLD